MSPRKPAPIGPLALAMRAIRTSSGSRGVVVAAVLLGLAVVTGMLVVLLR